MFKPFKVLTLGDSSTEASILYSAAEFSQCKGKVFFALPMGHNFSVGVLGLPSTFWNGAVPSYIFIP